MDRFQSTLPRRERLHHTRLRPNPGISIHAPTKGATCRVGNVRRGERISIHAPTKGATSSRKHFIVLFGISIHAPTKGATCLMSQLINTGINFNPRSHEGSDASIASSSSRSSTFQSTLPRRERLDGACIQA